MKYIVWNSSFDGYFVKWKNKGEDEFSNNWFDANKYKTIGPAISRLGLELNNNILCIEDFYNENKLSKSGFPHF